MDSRHRIIDSYERVIDRKFLFPEYADINDIGTLSIIHPRVPRPEYTYPVFGGLGFNEAGELFHVGITTHRQPGRGIRSVLLGDRIGYFVLSEKKVPDGNAFLTAYDPTGLTLKPITVINMATWHKAIEELESLL